MKEDEPSTALPILIIGVFMLAVFAGGFFALRAVQRSRAEAAATATTVIALTPPPTVVPPPTIPETIPPAPTATTEMHARPFGRESPGSLTATTPIPDAERVIARLRPAFRACYNRGLATDPSMSGNFVMSLKVSASGDVTDATKASGTGLSSEVEQCILRRAKGASFTPPGGSGSTLQVPITFVAQ